MIMHTVWLLWVKCADYLYSVLIRSIMVVATGSLMAVKCKVCWLLVKCADYAYIVLVMGKVC